MILFVDTSVLVDESFHGSWQFYCCTYSYMSFSFLCDLICVVIDISEYMVSFVWLSVLLQRCMLYFHLAVSVSVVLAVVVHDCAFPYG